MPAGPRTRGEKLRKVHGAKEAPVKPEPHEKPTWKQLEEKRRQDDVWWKARGVAMREVRR